MIPLLMWACGGQAPADSGTIFVPMGAYADCVVASEESAADEDASALLALTAERLLTPTWELDTTPDLLEDGLTLALQASIVPATLVRRQARVDGASCTDSLRVPVRGQVSLADGTVLLRYPWVQGFIEAPVSWSSVEDVELRLVGEGEAPETLVDGAFARAEEVAPGLELAGAELTLRLMLTGIPDQGQAVLVGTMSVPGGGGDSLRLWAGAW